MNAATRTDSQTICLSFSYSSFIRRTDDYLRRKRDQSRLWRYLLPEQIFIPELWLWQPGNIAVGTAWGIFWAIAPVPMQSIFAILCAMWHRANIPVALGACWISFPGYQLIVWPAQWWLGHALLTPFGLESDFSLRMARDTVQAILNKPISVACADIGAQLPTIATELLVGCLVSCSASAILVYAAVRTAFLIFHRRNAE